MKRYPRASLLNHLNVESTVENPEQAQPIRPFLSTHDGRDTAPATYQPHIQDGTLSARL
jgi:hypothetical protein